MTAVQALDQPVLPRPARRRIWLWVGAVVISAWVLAPIIVIGLAAFTPREALYSWPRPIIPRQFSLDTFLFFFNSHGVLRATLNSVLVAFGTIVLALALGAPAGYALARYVFPGRDGLRLSILATKMFPASILAVPLIVAFIRWHLYDTLLGVVLVHTVLALPFTIIITSSIFVGVPTELEEAALTLGCSRAGAFRRVVLPMALPGLAASAIFTFVLSWNEVFAATILTLNHRTLPALIIDSVLGAGAPLHFRFAGGFFMIVPALVIIFLIRRYLLTLWGVTVR